jgi:DDE superfamily endonuclease
LEIVSGQVLGNCRDSHTGRDFLAFLKSLEKEFPKGELHVVLDNSSTHKTPAVYEWLSKHPRIVFHFTPTSASWLNQVEGFFSILTPIPTPYELPLESRPSLSHRPETIEQLCARKEGTQPTCR